MNHYLFENLTDRQVILRLNSGNTLFIEPGKPSGYIPVEEVSNNTMVDKLLDRRIIAVHTVEKVEKVEKTDTPPTPAKNKKTKSKSRGGK